jgi:hypothetical protein
VSGSSIPKIAHSQRIAPQSLAEYQQYANSTKVFTSEENLKVLYPVVKAYAAKHSK